MGAFTVLLDATLRMATALAWPALGELVMERTGILNIGLEASVLWGALGGVAGALATGDPWGGAAAGAALGAASSAAFAWLVVRGGLDPVLTGTAVNLVAVGGTGFAYRTAYGAAGTGAAVPLFAPLWRSNLPIVGPVLGQSLLFFGALVTAAAVGHFFARTQRGVRWRACGEDPVAAALQGVAVARVRLLACLWGGALAGLGGAFLVVGSTGAFVERMSAGRGFMALAVVVLGRWRAAGVWAGALLFGFAGALQFFFQALGTGVAFQWFLLLPYALTLAVLALGRRRAGGPAVLT